jgi:CheY-like chemotaxis protein
LIADDQPVGREFIRTALESAGYEVIEAENGQEALQKTYEFSPDLILLDIHMPLRDGISVVAELRTSPRFALTPVIAVTATAMSGDRLRGIEAGFTDYVTKPVSLITLRQIVARFI